MSKKGPSRSKQELVTLLFAGDYTAGDNACAALLRQIADYIEARGLDEWEIERLDFHECDGMWGFELVIGAETDASHPPYAKTDIAERPPAP